MEPKPLGAFVRSRAPAAAPCELMPCHPLNPYSARHPLECSAGGQTGVQRLDDHICQARAAHLQLLQRPRATQLEPRQPLALQPQRGDLGARRAGGVGWGGVKGGVWW